MVLLLLLLLLLLRMPLSLCSKMRTRC
jgi:hypothetical protein